MLFNCANKQSAFPCVTLQNIQKLVSTIAKNG